MKDLQPKEFHKFIIMKKYIRKFVRLNMKISEEEAEKQRDERKKKKQEML